MNEQSQKIFLFAIDCSMEVTKSSICLIGSTPLENQYFSELQNKDMFISSLT
jgi:hypothetical protein